MGDDRRTPLQWNLSFVILETFIVLSLFAACILGGIAPNKNNAQSEHGEEAMRPKRQGPATDGMGVDLFYTSQCEGRTMDLRCPTGKVIMIEWANFGRTDTETCPGYGPVDDTNCRSEGTSYDIVSTICNNRFSCSVPVNIAVFGVDPCPDTFKFLEVDLRCETPSTSTLLPTTTPMPVMMTTVMQHITTKKPKPTNAESTTPEVPTTKGKTQQPPPPVDSTVQPTRKATTESVRTTIKNTTPQVPTTTPQPQTCSAVMERGISWPETRVHTQVTRPCPEGSTGVMQQGYAVWHCEGVPARWWPEAGPDLSACVSVWVQNITRLAGEGAPASEVTNAVKESVTTTEELYGGDIIEITEILDNSVELLEKDIEELAQPEREAKTKEVTENYVTITSSMLQKTKFETWDDLARSDQSDTASQLINSLEESAFLLAENLNSGSAVSSQDENVVLEVDVQTVSNILKTPVIQFPKPDTLMVSKSWENISDSIAIPTESIKQRSPSGTAKVVFLAYNNLEELLGTAGTYKFNTKSNNEVSSGQRIVNSRILSASINDPLVSAGLVKPAKLIFQHKQIENVTDPVCAYWQFINRTRGEWSDKGCMLVDTNKTHTTCECNHLTNFAIIMNVRGVEISLGHHFALSVITYAGFIISVVCLMIAFVTFSFFKNIQNDRNTIHKNLVLCLMIAEIVFLAGISQTAKTGVCTAVALMLHYFFLAAFCWMCLEGIQLYVMLVEVFEAESSRRKYYYPFGYGVPLFIVGISAAIDFHSYGTEEYCWLAVDNNFIWAFVAPVILVIMVNTVFLTMAIVIMCRHSTMQTNPKEKTMKEKITNGCKEYVPPQQYVAPQLPGNQIVMGESKLEVIISWLRGALVLLCLLGITWAFGLMYVSENSLIFAYIFTIANAFQGLFIFIFHCFMNDKVRKEYRRYVRNNDWIPDCIQNKYGGSYGSNQAQSYRSSSSNGIRKQKSANRGSAVMSGKRAAKDEAKRMSATTGSTSFERDRKFSASSYRNSGEYQGVKFTSLVVKPEKEQLENQRMSDEGIGLEIDDIQTQIPDVGSHDNDVTAPDVFDSNPSSNSSSHGSAEVVVAPPVVTPAQVKLGNRFEKQPLLNESPLRLHSPSEPDGYPEFLPDVKRDTIKNKTGASMPDLVFASSPWKIRKYPPSPTYPAPPTYSPPQRDNSNTLNQSLPNLPRSPVMQRRREPPPTYRRLNSETLTSPWAPRTPKPEEAIAIDNGPVEMIGYRKLKLETVI
ncbi:adhesion G protein-coupled receptor L2-like isoform X3 [Amphiura filiformis]|uniref:adhesion G protein-coupled receptor L2-like isoform X3 n=1 Tax=Amphiura filiformis TaxID=82378 RepID=UPI003B2164C2